MNDSDINQQQLDEQVQKALENMSTEEVRDVFIESMVLEKLSDEEEVDDEVFEELKKDLNDRLDGKINEKLLAVLPEDKVGELDSIIEGGADPEKIRSMLAENNVSVDDVVTGAMKELREEYLGDAAKDVEE
ncbi:hypothetical protein IKX64_02650 [Candidatus Saccharibacteria bacterium]|nr:hypothetical protein [Candidatus Saccharibacteria bacterium]